MNLQDTAAVIAYFGAAFPNFDPSDDTVDVWVAEVEDIDARDAADAMRNLVRTCEFPPTIAKFRAECKRLAFVRDNRYRPALTSGPMEWPKEMVDELRAALKEASARKGVPWVTAEDIEARKARVKR